ncbi:hypothetical protein SAMN05216299_11665 [Nitrosospira sp. Nsp14]|nr:hypothetical protein SAMN05216299_11665 [Nitrosospira sp. Nsp14]
MRCARSLARLRISSHLIGRRHMQSGNLVLRRGPVTKKAAEPLFLLPNKVPANAVRPLILNLKVQGGHLPDASGASV